MSHQPQAANRVPQLTSWIAVNDMMNEDFRKHVIEVAWQHQQLASENLQRFARQTFSQGLQVKGYRPKSVDQAPVNLAYAPLSRLMKNWTKASTAVIWLWAEARLNLIQDLRERASEGGLNLNPDWTLTDAVAGFFSPDDISDLFELAKAQSEEYISQSEYMLAAL